MNRAIKYLLLAGMMFFAHHGAHAQKKGIMFFAGGASFSMDDMKYFQEHLLDTYPVEGKIISSFPVYGSFSVNYLRQMFPHIRIGAGYAFTTTGAKSNYTDYSGSITTSLVATSHRLGAFIYYRVAGSDHIDLSIFGRLDANICNMEIATNLNAYSIATGSYNKLRSYSPNGSAGIELLYNVSSFSFGLEGSFLKDIPGELRDTDGGSKLYDPADNRRILTSDWTGWRAGVKFIFWLR